MSGVGWGKVTYSYDVTAVPPLVHCLPACFQAQFRPCIAWDLDCYRLTVKTPWELGPALLKLPLLSEARWMVTRKKDLLGSNSPCIACLPKGELMFTWHSLFRFRWLVHTVACFFFNWIMIQWDFSMKWFLFYVVYFNAAFRLVIKSAASLCFFFPLSFFFYWQTLWILELKSKSRWQTAQINKSIEEARK